MGSLTHTIAACDASAHQGLIAAIFHQGPVFRMGFDAHVRAWRQHTGGAALRAFYNDPDFRAGYHAAGGTFGKEWEA